MLQKEWAAGAKALRAEGVAKWRRGRGQCGWRRGKEGSEVGELRVVGRHHLPGKYPDSSSVPWEAILLWEIGRGTHLTQSGPAKFPLLGN